MFSLRRRAHNFKSKNLATLFLTLTQIWANSIYLPLEDLGFSAVKAFAEGTLASAACVFWASRSGKWGKQQAKMVGGALEKTGEGSDLDGIEGK